MAKIKASRQGFRVGDLVSVVHGRAFVDGKVKGFRGDRLIIHDGSKTLAVPVKSVSFHIPAAELEAEE